MGKREATSPHRYAAFLRGVSPTNANMPDLKACFEASGFMNVKTVLGTGNVVFSVRGEADRALERQIEAAMHENLGRSFLTIVRPIDALRRMLDSDPFAAFRVPRGAKRVVTLLRDAPRSKPLLPVELDGARILALRGREAFTVYVASPRGPVFMKLIQKTFGDAVTTRTWDTLAKVARSAGPA
jgi:uncharacterized protein (DUF1697 family)